MRKWNESRRTIKKYVSIPSNTVYVYKNDIKRLNNGEATFVFIEPEGNANDYEQVRSAVFQPAFKIDSNKYEVVLIMK